MMVERITRVAMEAAGELRRPVMSEQLISGAIVEQRAAADAVDFVRLPLGSFDHLPFNGHEQAEAELEEQLEEDVLLAAVSLEVLDGGFEGLGELATVRLPLANVYGIQLEAPEAEVSGKQRVLLVDFLSVPAGAFFGQFGDIAEFGAKVRSDFLIFFSGSRVSES
jgi:hypothetical protein